MKWFLFVISAFLVFVGAIALMVAESVMHEILAAIVFQAAAVLFGSAAIVEAIQRKGRDQ
jgi:multisubunit Na+/H+ antiporter MnhC subunit